MPILLKNETLIKIANKYNKSTAQICLRWGWVLKVPLFNNTYCLNDCFLGIEKNLVMLPKSVTESRILENIQVILKMSLTFFYLLLKQN